MGGRKVLGCISVLTLLAGGALPAQQPQRSQPTFRIASDLVVLDLIATDPDGRFVADLKPSEIQVWQDGKPQAVQFVTRVGGPRHARASLPSTAATADTTAGTRDPITLAIVVDLHSTPADALAAVKRTIASLGPDGLPPGSQVMLATLDEGLIVRQRLTPDLDAVRTAVHTLTPAARSAANTAEIIDTATRLCEVASSPLDPTPALHQTMTLARSHIAEAQRRLELATDSLGTLAGALGAAQGRKHVVFYSAGYALSPGNALAEFLSALNSRCRGTAAEGLRRRIAEELAPYTRTDTTRAVRQMIDRANRAQVALYAADTEALGGGDFDASQAAPDASLPSAPLRRGAVKAAQEEFLQMAASDTGGRAFLRPRDMAEPLRYALADAAEHYLVGYTPASTPKKGTFHRTEVKVSRPGVDLRYRAGYYEATDTELAARDVEQALRTPHVLAHTGLSVDARLSGRKLRVTSLVPPAAVRFDAKDGAHVGTISVHATLRDARGRLVGGRVLFGRDIALRLNPQQLDAMRQSDNVEIPVEVDVPGAGPYELTVAVRASGGWLGAQTVPLSPAGGSRRP
ncbi:MAG TPA: VWA domain-containing protein [Vicinamibacterales bacterium]|nr:VWA domain-containing protein [Vicinamibacterales bacterium]